MVREVIDYYTVCWNNKGQGIMFTNKDKRIYFLDRGSLIAYNFNKPGDKVLGYVTNEVKNNGFIGLVVNAIPLESYINRILKTPESMLVKKDKFSKVRKFYYNVHDSDAFKEWYVNDFDNSKIVDIIAKYRIPNSDLRYIKAKLAVVEYIKYRYAELCKDKED